MKNILLNFFSSMLKVDVVTKGTMEGIAVLYYLFSFIIGIGLLILLIMMIVKFFQMAADIRIIQEFIVKFYNKNEHEKEKLRRTSSDTADKIASFVNSYQENDSKGDLNDPEVLDSLLGLINQQKN